MRDGTPASVGQMSDPPCDGTQITSYFQPIKREASTPINRDTTSIPEGVASPEGSLSSALTVSSRQAHSRTNSSGSDDIPLRNRRMLRASEQEVNAHLMKDERRPPREPVKQSPPKPKKKPGPKPWATKPITKNDMAAKLEVIREIESFWGKNFIKAYIPKCHRPLIKRRQGSKRTIYRDHETNPKKWMPSVLKAILMIAKKTDDKVWLKKAMNEVVRYRIKNTGNRKPQLVTTDFDVIEDMLLKGWECAMSFGIRYKHLLMHQPRNQETDEDIDHILATGSADEDSDDEDDGLFDDDMEDVDDHQGGSSINKARAVSRPPLRGSDSVASGHLHQPTMVHPKQANSSQHLDSQNNAHNEAQLAPHQMYGPYGAPVYGYGGYMGYGMPPDGYGRGAKGHPQMQGYPHPMYGYLPPFGGYGAPAFNRDPRSQGQPGVSPLPPGSPFTQPSGFGLRNDHSRDPNAVPHNGTHGQQPFPPFPPFGGNQHRDGTPISTMDHLEIVSNASPAPYQFTQAKFKGEPDAGEQPISTEDHDAPNNYLGTNNDEQPHNDDIAAMELQIQAAEAEAKLLKLRAQLAAAKQARK